MDKFVRAKDGDRGRPRGIQNGQPGANPSRQAMAANAKIPLKKAPPQQEHQQQQQQPPPAQPSLPSRGLSKGQISSAVVQQRSLRRNSGQSQTLKHDPYDTDAESLDTTVDQSIIQVEDSQERNVSHQQRDRVAEPGEDSYGDEDREAEEEEEGEEDIDDYDLTQEEIHLLQEADMGDMPREQQLEFLQQIRPHGFRMVAGDSYPTTTDGDPTGWEGEQEPFSNVHNHGGRLSPSLQRPIAAGQPTHSLVPHPLLLAQPSSVFASQQALQKPSNLFEQSANLRDKQRSTMHPTQAGARQFQTNGSALPSSLPPTYSQAHHDVAPGQPHTRHNNHTQTHRPTQNAQRQNFGPSRVQFQIQTPIEPTAPPNGMSLTHPKVEQDVHQPIIEHGSVEELMPRPICDYDLEAMFAMNYDRLKGESFDTDPRAEPLVLTDDVLKKPFIERLDFVQKNLDAEKQSRFFSSLPTTEWEDAGDWFLDRFQSIIKRTKEARQGKRKLAQEFENEVEKRHKHVSKKQHQVEEAMEKMKTHGEGLVLRSPKSSKSPRPKKGR